MKKMTRFLKEHAIAVSVICMALLFVALVTIQPGHSTHRDVTMPVLSAAPPLSVAQKAETYDEVDAFIRVHGGAIALLFFIAVISVIRHAIDLVGFVGGLLWAFTKLSIGKARGWRRA